MKKLFPFLAMAAMVGGTYSVSHAQPVITSGITLPAVGTVDSVYAAAATVPPGSAGAGITWDFSALSLTYGGTVTVLNVSGSPYAATFPSANLCLQVPPGGTAYNYMNISSTGWNTIATSYAGVSTGQDYSPDNRLEVPFPFHYTDSVTDTYQMVGSSSETESIIYDGYGTLVTPLHTYINVIRTKKNYGSDQHYQWYTVSPFYLIMDYSSSGNNYIYIAEQPSTTGVAGINAQQPAVQVFPNPCSNTATLKFSDCSNIHNASVTITDVAGRIIKQIPLYNAETSINRDGMSAGLYLYSVYNNGSNIANGKLIIQ